MQFRIVSWNVENLFRPSSKDSALVAAYQAKLELIALTLRKWEPDVVALQEVGGAEPLADLQAALGASFPYSALSHHPDKRGIRVAFLSRRKLLDATDLVEFSPHIAFAIRDLRGEAVTRFRRGVLWAKVNADGKQIHLITAHLKSKLLDYPGPNGGTAFSTDDETLRAHTASLALAERTAEAVTLRGLVSDILAKDPNAGLILLGDLNDVPEAATTQILQGPGGSQPGTRAFDRPDRGDAARLFNLASLIPTELRYSRINSGVRELIDHILVSQGLLAREADGKRRAPVVTTHTEFQGGLQSVGTDPREREGSVASDHAPVVATFQV